MNKAELGQKGEAVAAKYYLDKGYQLLQHGYRTRMGEIDLILFGDDTLVFAEVKTRSSSFMGAPAEAVNAAKQRRLIAAAKYYLSGSDKTSENMRFDVVEVIPQGNECQVHCIKNAFTCD